MSNMHHHKCRECGGSGRIWATPCGDSPLTNGRFFVCHKCKGSGYISYKCATIERITEGTNKITTVDPIHEVLMLELAELQPLSPG